MSSEIDMVVTDARKAPVRLGPQLRREARER